MKKFETLLSVARIWGLLSMIFLSVMLVGHIFGEDTIFFSSKKEMLAFLFFPMGILLGLFIAYRSSLTGGSISLASIIGSSVLIPVFLTNLYFLFSIIPGFLFFIHGLLYHRSRQAK